MRDRERKNRKDKRREADGTPDAAGKKAGSGRGASLVSRLATGFILLTLAVGVGMLLYPTVSERLNALHQSQAIAGYTKRVETLEPEDYDAMFAAAERYNAALLRKPDRFRPTAEELAEYNGLLDPSGNGIMGYVTVPKIDVRLPIYHGTDETVLQTAIGHIPGSSLPVGGKSTHAVISGHRGLPSAKLFTRLDELMAGDGFILTVLNRELYYQVDQVTVVLPSEIEDIRITEGEDYCTLVTCTPYGINSHRMLIRGHRVDRLPEAASDGGGMAEDTADDTPETAQSGREIPDWMPLAFAGFAVLVIGGALLAPVKRRRK